MFYRFNKVLASEMKVSYCRLSSWIRGHALLTSQEYTTAIQTFRCIDSKTALKDNIYLMTSIAKAAFLDGHYTQAMLTFQRVCSLYNFPKF